MSAPFTPTKFHEELKIKHTTLHSKYWFNNNKYDKCVIKTKYILHPKCRKALKNKLKKYKLRRNGEEDPDVIDVSNILLSSLKIKSPRKVLKSTEPTSPEQRQRNYLFKMARRKKVKSDTNVSESTLEKQKDTENIIVSPVLEQSAKKHTNAFKLLMDSRNKSIGGNSPGKDKEYDPAEKQEAVENKKQKVKRNLALQKMAEAKGVLQKKIIEENEEKYIAKQMEKRAERLKDMILSQKPKDVKKKNKKVVKEMIKNGVKKEENKNGDESVNNKNDIRLEKKPQSLHLVDIFKDIVKPDIISPERKAVPKEDEEFLNKLSPSLKKKENMLCYFQKVEKKSEQSPEPDNIIVDSSPVIKVKITQKSKKKIKKRKLSLKSKHEVVDILKDHNENSCSDDLVNKLNVECVTQSETLQEKNPNERKRKRKENVACPEVVETEIIEPFIADRRRPKRIVKRPVKYADEVLMSSSDDELHIITPKKRKHSEIKSKLNSGGIVVSSDDDIMPTKKISNKTKKTLEKEENKKTSKLAPIFVPKPQLNPEQLEARQKFLYSGVPDQIKKIIAQQKNMSTEASSDFPTVIHVQQVEGLIKHTHSPQLLLLDANSSDEELDQKNNADLFKTLVTTNKSTSNRVSLPCNSNATTILQAIKECYPKFPVYRTYRSLKSKSRCDFKESNIPELDNSVEVMDDIIDNFNENPQYLNWTDKYKAKSTKQIIGNFESMRELRKWLLAWTENQTKQKNTPTEDSDSSDFCYDSDSNSRDCMKSTNNLLVLAGPSGCGKTSSVYAVAEELAIKVIEVNASSRRTGKLMLQDLQEATQSHKVNRGGIDSSQKSQDIPKEKTKPKRGRPKKLETTLRKSSSRDEMLSQSSSSQGRTGMSLILVDDADIVFDQDDGFSAAIAQLIQVSKRPVILVTGSLVCPHLHRFFQWGKILHMHALLPKMLGTWLDIMCLAENGISWPGLGSNVLDYYKGDMRKSINCLHFHLNAYTQNGKENVVDSQASDYKLSIDDEGSNMSWPDSENDKNYEKTISTNDSISKYFMEKQTNLSHVMYPKDLINVWWSVPKLLKHAYFPENEARPDEAKVSECLVTMLDTLSISDCYSRAKPDTSSNITSQPWYSSESDSVSEQENMASYDKSHEVTSDILHYLVGTSISEAQKFLKCETRTDLDFPRMTYHREKERTLSRHEHITDLLNPSAVLDRRGLALDYWSTCRTICRIEKNKNDAVLKRNNRFSHYLKAMDVTTRSETFESLCDSLSFEVKDD